MVTDRCTSRCRCRRALGFLRRRCYRPTESRASLLAGNDVRGWQHSLISASKARSRHTHEASADLGQRSRAALVDCHQPYTRAGFVGTACSQQRCREVGFLGGRAHSHGGEVSPPAGHHIRAGRAVIRRRDRSQGRSWRAQECRRGGSRVPASCGSQRISLPVLFCHPPSMRRGDGNESPDGVWPGDSGGLPGLLRLRVLSAPT
jgi:hypothetical protein